MEENAASSEPNIRERITNLRKADLHLTMSEIARIANVSRQRVHQILKEEGLPTSHQIRIKNQIKKNLYECPVCGTLTSLRFCSEECKKKWREVPVVCTRCGKLFIRDRHQFLTNYPQHNDGLFCSKVCTGKWYGAKYGFKRHPDSIGASTEK
jgi:transcription elongation factor Elf1